MILPLLAATLILPLLAAPALAATPTARCVRFSDLGIKPERQPEFHRLPDKVADAFRRYHEYDDLTEVWAAYAMPYHAVTLIYVRRSCLLQTEQHSLNALIKRVEEATEEPPRRRRQ